MTAGSAARCDLVLADDSVSRLHFELAARSDGVWVRDLGSRNRTYVNGIEVSEARVPAGGAIRIGTIEMTVTYPSSSSREEEPSRAGDAIQRVEPSLGAESVEAPLVSVPAIARFGAVESRAGAMHHVLVRLGELARSDASVLLEGEPGTGKKALARAIHDASSRAGGPFVVVECAALSDLSKVAERLEDALVSAEGGTLVLDAPAELSLAVQRELTPPLEANAFRVIVTTQEDLRPLVNRGAFRERLYFEIAGATVRVPPLRERREDIAAIVARSLGASASPFAPQLLRDLEQLPWRGNVRELELYVEHVRSGDLARAAAAARLDAVESEKARPSRSDTAAHALPGSAEEAGGAADVGRMLPVALEPWFSIGFKEFRERWIDLGEREYLRRLMYRTQRSSSAASKDAGLERTYLYRLLKKHGV